MPRPLQLLKHRICEHCGTIIPIFPSDIARFKGMFCSTKCAATHRKQPKLDKTCINCNSPFRTTLKSKKFCCVECEDTDTFNKSAQN